ncbi:MAG: PqqD family protein [Pyrinomonadaceae bacterium]
MTNVKNPLARTEDIVVKQLENETLIYDLRKNKAVCLNQTSGFVWNACDGKKTTDQIREELSRNTNSAVDKEMVWLAIEELKREDLIENPEELPGYFSGLSRRDVIKRIGLTSVIALPLISSVVAPNALFAQSCVAPTTPVGDPNGVPNNGPTSCDQFDPLCCNGDAGVTFTIGGLAFCGCSPAP